MADHLARARGYIATAEHYETLEVLTDPAQRKRFIHSLSDEDCEALITAALRVKAERNRVWWERKRERDAGRHMDVHCPACGAAERARCLRDGRRTDDSHRERAWKTRACPQCGASPGEWCKVGPVYTDRSHAARVEAH